MRLRREREGEGEIFRLNDHSGLSMCALLRRRTHAGAHSHSETLKYHSQMGFNDGRHPPRQFLNRISALAERCPLLPSVRRRLGVHCASPQESGRPCKGNHIIKSPTSPTSSVTRSIPCPKYCIKRGGEREKRTDAIVPGFADCPGKRGVPAVA